MCMCGWDLQLCLCPCIFNECRGICAYMGEGAGSQSPSVSVRVSVCAEDKDLAKQAGLVDR